jgi:hypothetical protein
MTRAILRRPVTLGSILQRLQRSLKTDSQHLYRGRGSAPRSWYIVDSERNRLVATDLKAADLERIARERGAMKEWEELEK